MTILGMTERVFDLVAQCGLLLIECAWVATLLITTLRSVWMCLRRDARARLALAKGLALALEFKLGGEVLRTTIDRDLDELSILCVIILLWSALTVFIHWEIKNEEADLE